MRRGLVVEDPLVADMVIVVMVEKDLGVLIVCV